MCDYLSDFAYESLLEMVNEVNLTDVKLTVDRQYKNKKCIKNVISKIIKLSHLEGEVTEKILIGNDNKWKPFADNFIIIKLVDIIRGILYVLFGEDKEEDHYSFRTMECYFLIFLRQKIDNYCEMMETYEIVDIS